MENSSTPTNKIEMHLKLMDQFKRTQTRQIWFTTTADGWTGFIKT